MHPESIQDLIESHSIRSEDLDKLLSVMKKSEDCPEEDEECKELTCPECGEKPLHTVFGTLPLQVKCSACSGLFFLKEIITAF